MIIFDLDGVLRDLCDAAGINPKTWDCRIANQSFVEYFTQNKNLLYLARPTEYLEVAKICRAYFDIPVIIMTDQPVTWHNAARYWVAEVFDNCPPTIVFAEDKISLLDPSDILIEDSPNLSSYEQVILVDKPYNQEVVAARRVHTAKELFRVLVKDILWKEL